MQTDEYRRMFELEDHYWWFVGRRNLALRLLREHVPPSPPPSVLDLGCGTGVVSRELSSWARPVSFDMSPVALNYSASRGLKRLVKGNGEHLPFQADAFDAVLGLDIFEHISDDRLALAETARVLRPGGVVVLSVPAFSSLWGPHDVALMHHRRYRRREVIERLAEAGFEPLKVSYSVFFLFPAVVGVRVLEKRKRGPAQASLIQVPDWVNRRLIGLQNFEASLISKVRLPWGSSVVAVGRKG